MLRPTPHQPRQIEPENLARELANTWLDRLTRADWPERLQLISDIHDQLRSDVGDLDIYAAVSPLLVARLIDGIQGGPVCCEAQAHIYANSSEARHREDAGNWLRQHQQPIF